MAGVDPMSLTKDKLRKELTRHNVSLPSPSARKDVYVNLYRSHVLAPLTPQRSEFSSDDDDTFGTPKQKNVRRVKSEPPSEKSTDVASLSDKELVEQLKQLGVTPGPIISTTRKLYQKKLVRLLEEGQNGSVVAPAPPVDPPADEEEFSDEDTEEPAPPPPPVSRAKVRPPPPVSSAGDSLDSPRRVSGSPARTRPVNLPPSARKPTVDSVDSPRYVDKSPARSRATIPPPITRKPTSDSVDSPRYVDKSPARSRATIPPSITRKPTSGSRDTDILTDSSSQGIFSSSLGTRSVTSSLPDTESVRNRKNVPEPTHVSTHRTAPIEPKAKPIQTPRPKPLSIIVQILVLIAVIVLIYLIFQNMEGAFVNRVEM